MSRVARHLYLKEHSVPDTHPCKPSGRTLLVLNVPPYVTEDGIKQLFSECGTVQRAIFQQKPTSGPPPDSSAADKSLFTAPLPHLGYQVVYVIFKDKSSINHAKSMPYSRQRLFSSDECHLVTGNVKWRQEYIASLPPAAEKLKAEVEQYMSEHDRTVEQEKEAAREAEGVADEEGWIKVTHLSRNKAATSRTESQDKRAKRKLKKRNREKELLHFYKFQVRESKKEQIMQLRQKFEEDKRQIAAMKAARKFRPY